MPLVHVYSTLLKPRILALKNVRPDPSFPLRALLMIRLQSGLLEIPSPTNAFTTSSHDDFRIHACAAALQGGFSLQLWATKRDGAMAGKQFDLVWRANSSISFVRGG